MLPISGKNGSGAFENTSNQTTTRLMERGQGWCSMWDPLKSKKRRGRKTEKELKKGRKKEGGKWTDKGRKLAEKGRKREGGKWAEKGKELRVDLGWKRK